MSAKPKTQTKTQRKTQPKAQRKILVIMSNRFLRGQKPRFLELTCDAEGNILKEQKLRSEPRQPTFDEVWENDLGKTSLDSCTRMKRKYGHRLEKPRT